MRREDLVWPPRATASGGESPELVERSQLNALRSLASVLLDDADYDCDFLKPTAAAFDRAWELVQGSYEHLELPPPAIRPAPTGDGGVFIRWKTETRELRLLVPAGPEFPVRLYYLGGARDGVSTVLSAADLGERLRWLVGV